MSGIVGKNIGRGSGIVKATPVGADTVSGANIADDAIDSEHYTDGSIDNAHIADDAIDSEHYADGSIDNAHIADDAIDSEHYADGSIDNAHIADDAIDSEHYADGSIDEAHIADNAVTLAKMAGGTDGNIISYDTSGDPVAIATGNDGQVLTSSGANTQPAFEDAAGGGATLRTEQATTSGTSVTFGSIPTGTKRIDILLEDVSTDDTDGLAIEIGDSGGLETSGYTGATVLVAAGVASTGGSGSDSWFLYLQAANLAATGIITLLLKDATNFTWLIARNYTTTGNTAGVGSGVKSLSAELTQIKIRSDVSANFDAGSINILYS